MATQYRALNGLSYKDAKGKEVHVEAGQILPNPPARVIKTYLEAFDVPQIEAIADEAPAPAPVGGE